MQANDQPRPDLATLLTQALEVPASQRRAFVDRVCGADTRLRRDLESLIAAHDEAGSFLERPPLAAHNLATAPIVERRLGEEVGSVIGRYRLLQLIGEGGFGAALKCTGEEAEPAELCLRRVTCMRQRGMTADDPVLLGALSDSLRFIDRAGRAAEGESFAREISSSLSRLGGGTTPCQANRTHGWPTSCRCRVA
jgi:hypothetical protein